MLSDLVAAELVRRRRLAGLTREQLAARCAEVGWPNLTFGVIGSIETGRRVNPDGPRRREVTLDEWIGLSLALDMPPALLVSPIGDPPIEIVPGRPDDTWTTYRWLIGELPTEMLGADRDPSVVAYRTDDVTSPIGTYRRHHFALANYLTFRGTARDTDAQRQMAPLAAARIEMHRAEWWMPSLPADVRAGLDEPLAAWGYRQGDDGSLIELPPAVDPTSFGGAP